MKKLLVLFALAAMVLGAAGLANALDVKAKGEFKANYNYWSNKDFTKTYAGNGQMKHSELVQRARIYFDFRANENINMNMALEIGDTFWGQQSSGGDISADQRIVEIKRAYMEFKWPTYQSLVTTVGIQGAVVPNSGYFGSAILDDDIAGVTVANKWNDMVSTVFGLYRASDNDFKTVTSNNRMVGDGQGIVDIALLAAPLTFDGFKATPFFSLAFMGSNATATGTDFTPSNASGMSAVNGTSLTDSVNPWWAGAAFEITALDPFAFYADFNYGAIDAKDQRNDRAGWLADLAVEYKGLSFMTPSIYGWYSTGIDDNLTNGDERMPMVSDGWAVGTTLYGAGRMQNNDDTNRGVVGTAGLGLKLGKISFLQDLTHDLYFYYVAGTNDADAVKTKSANLTYARDLTDEDHIIGLDFNNTYKIMEELSFMVDLGIGWADYDKDTWRRKQGNQVDEQATLYRTSVGLMYKF